VHPLTDGGAADKQPRTARGGAAETCGPAVGSVEVDDPVQMVIEVQIHLAIDRLGMAAVAIRDVRMRRGRGNRVARPAIDLSTANRGPLRLGHGGAARVASFGPIAVTVDLRARVGG